MFSAICRKREVSLYRELGARLTSGIWRESASLGARGKSDAAEDAAGSRTRKRESAAVTGAIILGGRKIERKKDKARFNAAQQR